MALRLFIYLFGGMILRSDRLQEMFYRWRCPGGGRSVKACIAAGECGCDNGPLASALAATQNKPAQVQP